MRDHPEKFDVGFLAALFGQEGAALRGFDFAPVGTGQVGDSFRVTLDWAIDDKALPPSLVAKCPAADAVSRDTARNMKLYEIETKFYEHFGTQCGARSAARACRMSIWPIMMRRAAMAFYCLRIWHRRSKSPKWMAVRYNNWKRF